MAKKERQFLLGRLCRPWELHAEVGSPKSGLPSCPTWPILYRVFWKEVSVAPIEDIQLWIVQCRILVQCPVLFSQTTTPLEKMQIGEKKQGEHSMGHLPGKGRTNRLSITPVSTSRAHSFRKTRSK